MFRALRMGINMICCYFILSLPAIAATKTAFEPEGMYTFYCNSASSQAKIVRCYSGCAVFYKYILGDCLTGESVTYRDGGSVESVLEEYAAAVLFEEDVDGVTNYYCYSSAFPYETELYGERVNLHIAIDASGAVSLGTPLIFGGF